MTSRWLVAFAAALRFRPPSSPTLPAAAARAAPAPPTVWRPDGGGVFPVVVRLGLSDGTLTELIDPPFGEGTMVVTQAK